MRTRLKRKTDLYFLLILFVSALLRVALTLFPKNAAVYADELLYLELAQNIWTKGITVYGIPLRFTKLLYPLLLSPFYLIQSGVLRTAFISVFNALLLSSALIPGYLLARRLLKKDSHILLSLLFLALSPNLLFSVTFMAENLYYPLLLWGFYFAYRFFTLENRAPVHALLLGFLAFLLYFTKEVGAAFAAALLFLLLRDLSNARPRKPAALSLFAFLAGLLLPFVLTRFVLFGNPGFTYASQAGFDNLSDASHLVFLLWAVLIHLLYFLASVLFVPVALPVSRFRRLPAAQQLLLLLSVVYVLCVAFGIAFGISLAEDYPSADLRVHLRYLLGAGFPFVLLTLAAPAAEAEKAKNKKGKRNLFLAAAVFAALLLLLTRLPRFGSPVDSPLLQLALQLGALDEPWLWLARLLLIALIFLLLHLATKGKTLTATTMVLVFALEITNSFFFACDARTVESLTPELSAQAEALAEAIRDPAQTLLVVTDDVQAPLLKALNTFSGRDYALTTLEDMRALSGSASLSPDGSVPASDAALPALIEGFSRPETWSLPRVDTVLVLPEGKRVLEPDAYEDITPREALPARLYRAKDPSRLTPLDRRSCFLEEPILFRGDQPNCVNYDLSGFSSPEPDYTWTDGDEASLTLRPRVPEPVQLLVTWECVAANGYQFCTVLANGTPVADLELTGESCALSFIVPAETYADTGLLTLTFLFPDAREPGNGDPRLLAAAFGSLTVEELLDEIVEEVMEE